jgi:hypothetical protein
MDVAPQKSILSRPPKHAASAEANSDVAHTIEVFGSSAFRSPLESSLLFRADQLQVCWLLLLGNSISR